MNADPPFPVVPERIAEIIFALCQTVSKRLRKGMMSQAQLTYIVGRLLGIRGRFQRLVARLRAGQTRRERARRPSRPAVPEPEFPLGFRPPPPGWRRWAVHAEQPVPLWRSLRQGFAWLLPLAPNVPDFSDSAAGQRALLIDLLAEPETRILLLASRRVGDSLRPLCWMLGIESSVLYPARPVPAPLVPGVNTVPSGQSADNRAPDPFPDPFKNETAVSADATPAAFMAAETDPPPSRARARECDAFSSKT